LNTYEVNNTDYLFKLAL